MTESPLIFSGPMVRAILEGRKTQTRRVVKHPEYFGCLTGDCPHETQIACDVSIKNYAKYECPYGRSGDRLWVRETFAPCIGGARGTLNPTLYRADECEGYEKLSWKPAIFMRRNESRLTLEIQSVRVERLMEISEGDAIAEGVVGNHSTKWPDGDPGNLQNVARRNFAQLWDSINGKKHPWASNPFCWVISFRKL